MTSGSHHVTPPSTQGTTSRQAYDIALALGAQTPPIPGDPPFARHLVASHATDGYEVSALSLCSHSGCHLDFPAHFLAHGKRAGDYPITAFFPKAVVVPCGHAVKLGPDLVAAIAITPGDAVLFQTQNSALRRFTGPEFPERFACLTTELAMELVRRGVGLVGLDALSVEPLTDPAFPVHHALLENDILILEGLDLAGVPPGRHRLICLPLASPEAEASPVRAVLLPHDALPDWND